MWRCKLFGLEVHRGACRRRDGPSRLVAPAVNSIASASWVLPVATLADDCDGSQPSDFLHSHSDSPLRKFS